MRNNPRRKALEGLREALRPAPSRDFRCQKQTFLVKRVPADQLRTHGERNPRGRVVDALGTEADFHPSGKVLKCVST